MPRGAADGGDEFITKLMPLENVDVNNMLPIIQPLVSPNGLLAAYAATNTLIIIDSSVEHRSHRSHPRSLDVEGSDRGVEVIRLNYAFATELAAILGTGSRRREQRRRDGRTAGGAARPTPHAPRRRRGARRGRGGAAAGPARPRWPAVARRVRPTRSFPTSAPTP